MAAVENYANNATTTVTSGGATAGTSGTVESWGVTSSATFPAASAGLTQFHVGDPAQPAELIAVTAVAGTAWTVTRGAESTTPVSHAPGFTVDQVITAGGLNAVAYNPMTALGDLAYGGTAPTAGSPARLAGGTTAIKQFLVQTGTGSVSAAPAWGTIASADMPTGTTSAKGALQLDGTAANITANGIQSAGAGSLAAISTHIHPDLSLFVAPAGATAEVFPRRYANATQAAMSSGTLYVSGIAIGAGIVVNNITMMTSTTAKLGGTHGWYALLDSNLIVRAITADQTDPATVWGTVSTVYTLPTNSYTTTYAGLYYIGVMVAVSAGTVPTFLGCVAPNTSVNGLTPLLAGTSSVGQTTPPATGATMASLSNTARQFYAYTS